MGKAADDLSASKFYIVEVIGHDGVVHHVGPFHQRADAECWITQNTPNRFREALDASRPRLSLV